MPAYSKLHLIACMLALVPAACAPRSRATAAPAAPAPANPLPRGADEVGTLPTPSREVGTPVAADPILMRERVARLLGLVASFAREQDWAAAREKCAEALHGFADAIAVAPAAIDRARVAALAGSVRAEAERLARTSDPSLERADLAKAGLLAATGALEELAAPQEGSLLARLLSNAHDAARAIDEHSPFTFERARIQDAFRAAADAYLVFADRSREPRVASP